MAPEEEAYFKMLGPEDLQPPKMKDDSNRLVCELQLFQSIFLSLLFEVLFRFVLS